MTRLEKVELSLVACGGVAAFLAASWLPESMAAGMLVLCGSVMMLGQGLVRDLWLKFGARVEKQGEGTRIVCMCMESTLGMTGVVAGAAALLGGLGAQVALPSHFWPAFVLGMGVAGFLIKDLIIDVDRRTIRREKNHRSILVW